MLMIAWESFFKRVAILVKISSTYSSETLHRTKFEMIRSTCLWKSSMFSITVTPFEALALIVFKSMSKT